MKKTILLAAFAATIALAGCNKTNELPEIPVEKGQQSLYDRQKTSAAYIYYDDEEEHDYDSEATIYSFEGFPVAYLVPCQVDKSSDKVKEVYGFNGKHLGWLDDGVVWDKDGNAVGAKKGVVRWAEIDMTDVIEKVMGGRYTSPIKTTRYVPWRRPESWSGKWSETSLADFLKSGMKE